MCSPSNAESRTLAVQTQRERRPGRKGKKGQHLPAKNHWCRRENENTPLRPSNAPTERTCLLSIQKLCTAKQAHRENLCHHKDVWETVSSPSLPLYRCKHGSTCTRMTRRCEYYIHALLGHVSGSVRFSQELLDLVIDGTCLFLFPPRQPAVVSV